MYERNKTVVRCHVTRRHLFVRPCVCRYIPAVVIVKAADTSSAAALRSDVASGSAERRSRLWKAGWVRDTGDGDGSRPAQSKATRQTASSTESESESAGFIWDQTTMMSCSVETVDSVSCWRDTFLFFLRLSLQFILELCRNEETANILCVQPHLERMRPPGHTGVSESSVFTFALLQFPKNRWQHVCLSVTYIARWSAPCN